MRYLRISFFRHLLVTALALSACLAAVSASAAGAKLDLRRLDSYFAKKALTGAFNGVVLVGQDDRIIFDKAYGFADFENRIPLRTDHIFRIGSLTKPVTASAVLKAVDAGKLSLDEKACLRLSSCPKSWEPVTIAQLLSHRAGIKDHFGDLKAVPVEETVAELKRVLFGLDPAEALNAPAGRDYAYSNFNYVLLGAIVENVYRRPWRDVVRETVAAPAGARSMDYDYVFQLVANRVRGYDREKNGAIRNIKYDDHAAYAAGGLRSTADDFFRWSRAALGARLFSATLRDLMVAPPSGNYGFGWQVREFFGRRVFNHTGGVDGFSTHIAHYPDSGLTVIVFTNVESDSALLAACDAASILFDFRKSAASANPVDLQPRERCGF